ncbi:MAG: hypothetical protein WBQ94_03600 [Terracidiphilus sp.]
MGRGGGGVHFQFGMLAFKRFQCERFEAVDLAASGNAPEPGNAVRVNAAAGHFSSLHNSVLGSRNSKAPQAQARDIGRSV